MPHILRSVRFNFTTQFIIPKSNHLSGFKLKALTQVRFSRASPKLNIGQTQQPRIKVCK